MATRSQLNTTASSPSNRRRISAAGGLTLAASLITGSATATAATYTVANTSDASPVAPAGSLREALEKANANVGTADMIVFASGVSGTIDLAAPLNIESPVDLQGPGSSVVTVDGGGSHRGFYNVSGGSTFAVTISGVTITGGVAGPDGAFPFYGGGILSYNEDLTVADAVITGNVAGDATNSGYGGGIYAKFGSLTVRDSTIAGNLADGPLGSGGGIYDRRDALSVQSSTIAGNSAYIGGGVALVEPYSASTIQNSTITGNQGVYGGGIYDRYLNGESFTITGSTVAANSDGGAGSSYGGGIDQNSAAPYPVLENTIVSGNTAATGTDLYGQFDSSFSLIGNTAGATIAETVAGSNIIGQDPQLGSLQDNGGSTYTMAPSSASPAIDTGSSFGLVTDQRGLTRPSDFPAIANSAAAGADGADIGAVELQAPPETPSPGTTTAKCAGKAATLVGTPSADRLKGTGGRDVIAGLGGRDRISAFGGKDLACGGGGKDVIRGGSRADKLLGQRGNDKLVGGSGNDVLKGGRGKDKLLGRGGKDKLVGGPGRDKVSQ